MTLERREFLRRLASAAALAPLTALPGCSGQGEAGAEGARVAGANGSGPGSWTGYDESFVVDALAGPIQFNIPQSSLPLTEADLDAVARSGITAVNLTVNARATDDASAHANTVARIAEWSAEAEAHPDVLLVAHSVADIHRAKDQGRLGLVLGFQDAVPFEHDLSTLDDFHGLGVRIIQLTYNVQNLVGAGCLAPEDTGLTDLGREAVGRMDDLGILVDLSHCGRRTTLDGIAASTGPVSITHSGCRSVFDHPRSKDDETLRLLAQRGGVVGIYLMPFLNASGPPTAEDVIVHVEHALNVCGEDHVGIGSDQGIVPLDVSGDFETRFDEVSAQRSSLGIAAPREDTIPYVPDLNHPRRLEAIGEMMASRGHAPAVIDKVIGGNFMRLFGAVWGG